MCQPQWERIDILGTPAVTGQAGTVTGAGLGGRRAQVALVALALEPSGVTSDRLAEMIWADDRPATWQAALRGVIRGLRTALRDSAGDQLVILTEPGGYRIAPGIEVDLLAAEQAVGTAAELNRRGRHRAALDAAAPVTRAGSILQVHFLSAAPVNHEEAERADLSASALLHLALLNHGVYTAPRGMLNLSTVLGDDAPSLAAEAYAQAFADVAREWGQGRPAR